MDEASEVLADELASKAESASESVGVAVSGTSCRTLPSCCWTFSCVNWAGVDCVEADGPATVAGGTFSVVLATPGVEEDMVDFAGCTVDQCAGR
jgi:hypothetical protein